MEKTNKIEILNNLIKERYKEFDTIYTYEGIFDKDVISLFSKKLSVITKYNPRSQKRLFPVFIELAQNVSYYSDSRNVIGDDKETGVGTLIIGENPDYFYFVVGNEIGLKPLEVLSKKCEIINSLERDELREYKRQQRNLIPGTNGGAHIGLIMVSLTTKRPLNMKIYEFKKNKYYFTILVEVEKLISQSIDDN